MSNCLAGIPMDALMGQNCLVYYSLGYTGMEDQARTSCKIHPMSQMTPSDSTISCTPWAASCPATLSFPSALFLVKPAVVIRCSPCLIYHQRCTTQSMCIVLNFHTACRINSSYDFGHTCYQNALNHVVDSNAIGDKKPMWCLQHTNS